MAGGWTGHGAGADRPQGRATVQASARPSRPHTLRHAFITAALDAGCAAAGPSRNAASHARSADHDAVTDRLRGSLDRHATYIVAVYVAGAAR